MKSTFTQISAKLSYSFRFFVLFAVFFAISISGLHAQSLSNYTVTRTTAAPFTLVSGSAIPFTWKGASKDDNLSNNVPLGFNFYYNGNIFSSFHVSTNGFLGLGTISQLGTGAGPYGYVQTQMHTPNGSTNIIAAIYDDLQISGSGFLTGPTSSIKYEVLGLSPNKILTVQWLDLENFNNPAGTDLRFQVKLFESDGHIEVIYGIMTNLSMPPAPFSYAVGLSGSTISAAPTSDQVLLQQTNNTDVFNNTIPPAHSPIPVTGSKLEFRPEAITPVSPITFSAINIAQTSMDVRWADNSTNETFFTVSRSTAPGGPFNKIGTVTSTTKSGTGTLYSFTNTGLVPSTVYYYQITANSEGRPPSAPPLSGNASTLLPGLIFSTAAGGLWGSTTTWVGGQIPTVTDEVTIVNTATVTINVAAVAFVVNLEEDGAAVLQYEAASARSLTVSGDINIGPGAIFRSAATGTVTTHALTIGRNLFNNGTIDFSTNSNTAGARITFNSPIDAEFNVSNVGNTDLRSVGGITVNKSNPTSNFKFVEDGNAGTFTVEGGTTLGFLTLTQGVFEFAQTFAPKSFPIFTLPNYSIPATATFYMNNSNGVVLGQNGNATLEGTFKISAGTYNVGTSPNNTISGALSKYDISGGILNIGSRLVCTGAGTFAMDKGIVNITTLPGGNTLSSTGGFDFSATTSFVDISGGDIYLVQASTAATPLDYRINSASFDITGGILHIGKSTTATNFNFRIAGLANEIEIDNAGNAKTATLFGSTTAFGNTTIQTGSSLILNGFTYFHRGDQFSNGGTLNGAALNSTLYFLSTKPQTLSGLGAITSPLRTLSVENLAGLTISHNNQIPIIRANLFQGLVTGSNKLLLGINGTDDVTTQIGAVGITTAGGSYSLRPLANFGTGTYSVLYAPEAVARITGTEIPLSRVVTNVLVNNINGVTLSGGPLGIGTSTGGILTLTNGKFTTSAANLLTINNTSVGAIITPSASSYIVGPMARVLPANQGLGSTYVFPVGKTVYNRLEYVNATTNSGGTVTIETEVFDTGSGGTAGAGIGALNTNKYWTSFVTNGGANLTGTQLRFFDASKGSADAVGASITVGGVYNEIGAPSTSVPASVTTSTIVSYPGYYQLGSKSNVILSALAISPTGNLCTNVARTITVTANPAAVGIVIEYQLNGVNQSPIPMTNIGGFNWSGVIPTISPANANVVWTVKSTDGFGFTKIAEGTPYSDEPLFTVNIAPLATPAALCSGSASVLSAAVSGGSTPATYTGTPSVGTPTDDEDIINVTIKQGAVDILNNTSLVSSLSSNIGTGTGTAGGYANYTAFGPYSVNAGQTYDLSVQIEDITPDFFNNRVAIYVDYNRNGVYTDAGEQAYLSPVSGFGPNTQTGSFLIPATALNGITRMRVICVETTGSITSPTPFVSFGEFEDYALNITSTNFGGGTPPVVTSFSWFDGTSVVGNTNPLSVSPLVNTTYTLTITALGCTKVATPVVITVNPLPTLPNGAGSLQCGTQIPTASVTSTSGLGSPIFKWYTAATGGTLLQTSTSTTYLTAISATQTFHVSEANAGGCESGRRAVTVTVTAADAISIAASPVLATYCPGSSVSLIGTKAVGPNVYSSLTWTANTYVGSGLAGPVAGTFGTPLVVTPTIVGTYIYTLSGFDPGPGCAAVATRTIIVFDPFAGVTFTSSNFPTTFCLGATTDLSVTLSGGPIPPTYSPLTATSAADEDIGNVTILQGVTPILNNTTPVSSLVGTIGTATGVAAQYSNFTAFGPYGLVANGNYNFSLTSVQTGSNFGHRFAIYIDYNRNGSFGDSGEEIYNSSILTSGPHTETGTFTVPAGVFNGTARMRVITNEGTISSGMANFTFGEVEDYTILLSGGVTGGGSSSTPTFSWSDGATVVGTTNPSTVTPTANTTYTVTMTIGACTATSTVSVTPNIVTGAIISGTGSICAGQSQTIQIAVTGPGPWNGSLSNGGGAFAGSTSPISVLVTPAANITYTIVNLGGGLGCVATTPNKTGSAVITVNALPTASITGSLTVCSTPATTLLNSNATAGSGSITGYQWQLGVVDISGATSSTYAASTLGSYTVRVTNSNTCSFTSAPVVVTRQQYTVTASSAGNGTISPVGATLVNCSDGIIAYTFTPNVCYRAVDALLNGVTAPGFVVGSTSYTLTGITANSTFQVVYALIPYSITITPVPLNGLISVASTVNCGTGTTATITPNFCYQITDVLVNGTSVGAVSTYNFVNVTANQTISATFSKIPYPVTSSVNGGNGTITPLGATIVLCGNNITYTITPDAGYGILDVKVDGISQGAIATYTFTNVTVAHTIEAFFFDNTCNFPPTAFAGNNSAICSDVLYNLGGSSTNSTALWSSSGTGTFNGGSVFGTATTYTPSPADITAGSVLITLTAADPDAGGPCIGASSSFTLTINKIPTSTGITGTFNYCTGSTTLLSSNALAGSGTISGYQWILNGTDIPGATSATFAANAAGTYTVRITNSFTCSFTTPGVSVITNANPTVTISADCNPVFPGSTTTFTAVATAGSGTISTYQWRLNGVTNVGTNLATYSTTVPGSYTCIVTNTSGLTCSTTSNAVVLTNVTGPLAGIYSVGSPGCSNFITLTSAISYLNNNGISAPVTINVADGYTETVVFGGITLGSVTLNPTLTAVNTLLIKKAGAGANPILTAYTGGSALAGSANPDGIFRLVGTDYVTIDGINLTEAAANTTAAPAMEFGYGLFKLNNNDGARNNTITRCVITLTRNNFSAPSGTTWEGSAGIAFVNATATAATTALTPTAVSGANSFNKIYANTIQNVNTGVAAAGFVDVAPYTFADIGNDFGGIALATGNSILNFGGGASADRQSSAFRLTNQYSINVSYNTINNNTGAGVNHIKELRGIWGIDGVNSSLTFTNNTITLKSAGVSATDVVIGIDNAMGGVGTNNVVNISNNTIRDFTHSGAIGVTVISGIILSVTPAQVIINGNTIQDFIISNTGPIDLIRTLFINGSLSTTSTINGNTIQRISRTGASGTIRGIVAGTVVGVSMDNNLVDVIGFTNAAAAGGIDGILNAGGSGGSMSNNIVRNLSTPVTQIRGIVDATNSGVKSISNNQVYNFTTLPVGVGTGTFVGITIAPGSSNVSNNQVYNLNRTGTGTVGNVTGMSFIGNAISNSTIAKNKIYDLTSTGNISTTAVIGINITNIVSNSIHTISNNFIGNLFTPASLNSTSVSGILNNNGGLNLNTMDVFNNTINLSGTSSSATFGTSAISTLTGVSTILRNNILINKTVPKGTALAVAYRRSTTAIATYSELSDNNLMFAGTPSTTNLLFSDGTNNLQTIDALRTFMISRDQASVSADVPFINTTGISPDFLNIADGSTTQAESGGMAIAGLVDDYEGTVRAATPDIGADEFNGINDGPRFTTVTNNLPANQCAATARTITANFTAAITSASLRYSFNGVPQIPVVMAGSGTGPWTGIIPAATPTNARVTYTIVATNAATRTSSFEGTSYQDAPNGSFTSVATPVLATVCQATNIDINAVLTNTTVLPSYTLNPNPPITSGTVDDDLGNVTFGSIVNTSVFNSLTGNIGTASVGPAGTYSNYSSLATVFNFTAGTSYPISLTNVNNSGSTNAFGVFIDYNRNGLFTDAGEFVFASNLATGNRMVTSSITIPNSALPGKTRMRVIVKVGSLVTSPTEGFTFGETEDYLLEIVPNFTFAWNDGGGTVATTQNLAGLAAGTTKTYTLTATDQNGCVVVSNGQLITVRPTGTYTNATADNQWNTAGNWCGGIPTAATNVILPLVPTVATTDIIANSIVINSGASLTVPTGRILTITNNGSITNNSTTAAISSGTGTVVFAGAGTVTGPTIFRNLIINGGLSIAATGTTTVNGTLTINNGGFINAPHSPVYGPSSLLLYNSGTLFNRGLEWGSNAVGPGYPNDVQISNNTQVNLGSNVPAGKTINNATQRNLTIDGGGCALYMDFGGREMRVPLVVGGDLLNNGTMTLSSEIGFPGDLKVKGNLTNNGTFNGYDKAIFFTNNGSQTVTSSTQPFVIPYFVFQPPSGSNTVVLGSNISISGSSGGDALQYFGVNDRLNLNGFDLLFGTFGSAPNFSGGGAIIGNPQSDVTIQGNASGSNINFRMDQTSKNNRSLRSFALNRTANPSVTLTDSLRLVANDVDFGSGGLYLTNGTFSSNNFLVLGSTALGTARIATIPASADVIGNIVAERYTTGANRRYRHFGSPVNQGAGTITYAQFIDDIHITGVGGTLNGFDAGNGLNRPSVFTYDEPIDDNSATIADQQRGFVGITNVTNTLATGRGVLALVRGPRGTQVNPFSGSSVPAPTTLDFIGASNKGNISIPVTFTLHLGTTGPGGQNFPQIDGFNLVANPYPSQFNPGPSILSNPNLLKRTNIYNISNGSYGVYDYTLSTGTNGATPFIALGQGFMLEATASTNLNLGEIDKVGNPTPGTYFKTSTIPNLIRIKMVRDSLNSDESIVVFGNGSHTYYEPINDALKFFGSSVNLSTRSSDGMQLAINRYPNVVLTDTIPMPISSAIQSGHDLKFSGLDSFDPNVDIYLLDQFLGTTSAISNNMVHNFTITADPNSQGAERFKLIFDNQAPLPVLLLSFNGKKNEMTSLLTWKTASISGKPTFEVQRSVDGKNFEQIGTVKSNGGSTYDFTDLNPIKAINYYRLKMVDANGKSELSRIVAIDFSEAAKTRMVVYPNPFTNQVTLRLAGELQESYVLNVTDNFGRKLVSNKVLINSNEIAVSLADIAAGVYTIELMDATTGNLVAREKVVKQ